MQTYKKKVLDPRVAFLFIVSPITLAKSFNLFKPHISSKLPLKALPGLQHSDSMYRTSKSVTNFRIPEFSVLICLKNIIGNIEHHKKKFVDLYLNESLGKVFKIVIQKNLSFIYNRH